MRRSDAEDAAVILKGRGYITFLVSPEMTDGEGLVLFVHPADAKRGPGVFGAMRVTDEDVIRHDKDPDNRTHDLERMADRAEDEWRSVREHYGNQR